MSILSAAAVLATRTAAPAVDVSHDADDGLASFLQSIGRSVLMLSCGDGWRMNDVNKITRRIVAIRREENLPERGKPLPYVVPTKLTSRRWAE